MTGRNEPEELKRVAAEAAAREVVSGQVVGLGTGSTAYYAMKLLGERIAGEGLAITGIPTSRATEVLARECGISLGALEEHPQVDIAIDGADQVGANMNLIKGGGGAHVREKVVAAASKRFIVVIDETKVAQELSIPVPVEVIPFALGFVARKLKGIGGSPSLRMAGGAPFISDNGNYVVDVDFGSIFDPAKTEREINLVPGVVDNGIFSGLASEVFVGTSSGLRILRP